MQSFFIFSAIVFLNYNGIQEVFPDIKFSFN